MKIKQIRKTLIMAIAVLGLFLTTTGIQAQKYKSSDMPKAVIEAFNKMYPNATAIGYDIENENGGKFYEVESKEGDIRRDLLFNADGSISEIEEVIPVSSVPDNVTAGVYAKYPKGRIIKAQKVTKGSETLYEVVVKNGKKKLEVRLNTNGEIVGTDND